MCMLYMCVYVSLSLSLYIYIYICMCVCIYIYIYIYLYIYIYVGPTLMERSEVPDYLRQYGYMALSACEWYQDIHIYIYIYTYIYTYICIRDGYYYYYCYYYYHCFITNRPLSRPRPPQNFTSRWPGMSRRTDTRSTTWSAPLRRPGSDTHVYIHLNICMCICICIYIYIYIYGRCPIPPP